jgi:hypothetical protein
VFSLRAIPISQVTAPNLTETSHSSWREEARRHKSVFPSATAVASLATTRNASPSRSVSSLPQRFSDPVQSAPSQPVSTSQSPCSQSRRSRRLPLVSHEVSQPVSPKPVSSRLSRVQSRSPQLAPCFRRFAVRCHPRRPLRRPSLLPPRLHRQTIAAAAPPKCMMSRVVSGPAPEPCRRPGHHTPPRYSGEIGEPLDGFLGVQRAS